MYSWLDKKMAVFQLLITEKSGACVNPYDAILLQLNGRDSGIAYLGLLPKYDQNRHSIWKTQIQ